MPVQVQVNTLLFEELVDGCQIIGCNILQKLDGDLTGQAFNLLAKLRVFRHILCRVSAGQFHLNVCFQLCMPLYIRDGLSLCKREQAVLERNDPDITGFFQLCGDCAARLRNILQRTVRQNADIQKLITACEVIRYSIIHLDLIAVCALHLIPRLQLHSGRQRSGLIYIVRGDDEGVGRTGAGAGDEGGAGEGLLILYHGNVSNLGCTDFQLFGTGLPFKLKFHRRTKLKRIAT